MEHARPSLADRFGQDAATRATGRCCCARRDWISWSVSSAVSWPASSGADDIPRRTARATRPTASSPTARRVSPHHCQRAQGRARDLVERFARAALDWTVLDDGG